MILQEVSAQSLPDSWKALPARWGHSLHTVCSRTCSFPPRLAHYFIQRYSKAGQTILDVYSGKGTAPLEACLLGRKGIGNDISPDAFTLTYAKTNPPAKSDFFRYLEEIRKSLRRVDASEVPDNVQLYFEEKTLEQILAIREIVRDDLNDAVKKTKKYDMANFLQAMMLGILHGSTKCTLSLPVPHSFAMSPSYVRRRVTEEPRRFVAQRKDVVDCLKIKAERVFRDAIPDTFKKGDAFMVDAVDFELDEAVDMALSSPPYFNAHTYAWDNWLRLWFLGHDHRKVASQLLYTTREDIYLGHLQKMLERVYRLLKDDSRFFLVVGDVKGHRPTAFLIADLVERSGAIGFKVHQVINDTIDKKLKYLYGDNSHVGIQKDRILELHKGYPPNPNGVTWPPSCEHPLQAVHRRSSFC